MKTNLMLLSLLVLSTPCWSQNSQLSLARKLLKIDSMITTWHQQGMFNGGILIAQKGKILFQRAAGYANVERKIPNSDTTHFNLASVSKPFTAIAMLQLVQIKRLKLTDPVVRYLPDFPYPAVTIEQLLAHTAGLPEADQFEKPYIATHPLEILSNRKIYADLVNLRMPPLTAAGEKHFYNNLNFIVLALLLEKITGTPFNQYMKKNLFEKADMKHTYIRDRISPNTARYFLPTFYDTTFYNVDLFANRKIYTDYPLGGTYGDNNVVTTLQDMVKFDQALNNGTLLSPELVKRMYEPVKLVNGDLFFLGGTKTYTLGWNVNEKNSLDQFAVWHDGSLVGLTTILFRNMTDEITYILYENRTVPNFFRRFLAITNVMDGVKITEVSQQKSLVREYGAALFVQGAHYAAVRLNELKANPGWYFYEHEMNELGYDLLRESTRSNHVELSLEVFKLNTLLFPASANTYDSYAEALQEAGMSDEAIRMYQKALQLNPNNEQAQQNLKKLTGRK